MVRKRGGSRPSSMQSVMGCNGAKRAKKGGHKRALCGCTSRQQNPSSSSSSSMAVNKEAVEAQNVVEPPQGIPTARSPLNDVTDLLCGIKSVEITVKQPSTD